MSKNLSRLPGAGRIFILAMVGLLVASSAYAAPLEESISGSAPDRSSTAPRSSAAPSRIRARVQPENDLSNEAPATNPFEAPSDVVSQPRASFPYTIRAGDTPASIASVFGVPLPDLMRANHLRQETELMIGQTLRVPNPFLARERELSAEIDRLSAEKQAADQHAQKVEDSVSSLRSQVQDLNSSNSHYGHDLRMLPWWRTATFTAVAIAALMFALMMVALVQWWVLRSRFQAVVEMNESLRRLDLKYKAALAKAELRFQEIYGRRRRGVPDTQERPKIAEEAEIEQLNRRLTEVLNHHLRRLDRPTSNLGRARWRERLAGVGSPVEARSVRR